VFTTNRSGLPGQDEERGLERVFGVGIRSKDAPTGCPDGIGVPANQVFKSDRIVRLDESPQELPVGSKIAGGDGGRKQPEEESTGHFAFPIRVTPPLFLLIRHPAGFIREKWDIEQ
jgi:hypothetical protein